MAGVWRKTLIYLGLAEEDEDYDEYAYEDLEPEEPRQRRAPARRAAPAPEPVPEARPRSASRRTGGDGVVTPMPSLQSPRFHLVQPTAFNDAQEIGDKFREGFSVIMNLQSADPELSRRLVDFASGLAYGLGGSMQPAAERVFLITPQGVAVSAEERRRFLEDRGFFNQA
ncbi:MAG: cell division protein SepF [Actinomycetota bacterium]|nr:cell division protein SepF [Actinomycetota bacterium]